MAEKGQKRPRSPAGLGTRGRRFWRKAVGEFDFEIDDLEVLEEVARTLDGIDALAQVVADDGFMIEGSRGQRVLHPAVQEVRQQRLAVTRMLRELGLPDLEDEEAATPAQLRGRRAARARWGA